MKTGAPRVSVIVPNYNHARFIEQRIESVLNQTFADFELLYLDDASTDGSAAVVEKYRTHPKVRMIENERNSGSPFAQWNKGVHAARGELVWIAEADDYADPRLLQRLVAELDARPNTGVAYCQSWAVDAHGAILSSYSEHTADLDPERWKHNFVANGREECSRFLSCKNTVPNASAVVFRRALYVDAGGAEETLRFCGDWLLWANLIARCDVSFVSEHLNYFRSHAGSVTHGATRNGLEVVEAYTVLRRLCNAGLVGSSDLPRACETMMRRWMQIESASGGIPWRRRAQIYRVARVCDPHLLARLFTHSRRSVAARLRQRQTKTATTSAVFVHEAQR